jgi:hypothetical protein
MSKSKVSVHGPVRSSLCKLDTLCVSDAFVDPCCNELHLVFTPPGRRRDSGVKCIRLTTPRGTTTFEKDTMVRPVDIHIEWGIRLRDYSHHQGVKW